MLSNISKTPVSNRSSAWIPAMLGIALICAESTNRMGATHTALWMSQFAHWTGHSSAMVGLLNHIARKSGHFTGYGLLGLCFARGWLALLRSRFCGSWSGLRLRAGALGTLCASIVASCDEIHQSFLPTRGASVYDVLLDTGGAVVLTALFFGYLLLKRRFLSRSRATTLTPLGI